MSNAETMARPYARAVFELGAESGKLKVWSQSLKIAAFISANRQMQAILSLPSLIASEKAALFLSIYSGVDQAPEVSDELKNLLILLAENSRLIIFPEIASSFEALKQVAEGNIELQVKSALDLTLEQRDDIVSHLAQKLGKRVSITIELDKSLIAGAIIRAGDMVIDGSVRGRLEKLTLALSQ